MENKHIHKIRKRRLYLFCVLLFYILIIPLFSYANILDSLYEKLKVSSEDTNKVLLLQEISNESEEDSETMKYALMALELSKKLKYKNGFIGAYNNIAYCYTNLGQLDTALEFHLKGLELSEELSKSNESAIALNAIGAIYRKNGDNHTALEYYNQALSIREKLGGYDKEKSNLLNSIGILYYYEGNITLALEYLLKSLKLREESEDSTGIGQSLNYLGLMHKEQGDISKAKEFYERSLSIQERLKNKREISKVLNNLSFLYSEKGELDTALYFNLRSLVIRESISDYYGISESLNSIGGIYFRQKKYQLALETFLRTLTFREKAGDKNGIANTLNNIGSIYSFLNKHQLGIEYCKKALTLSQELEYPLEIKNSSKTLSDIYSKIGNYKAAYEMHVLHKRMDDTLINLETRKSTVKQQMQYDFDRKEALSKAEHEKKEALAKLEIDKQRIRKNIYLGSGVSILSISFLLFSLYRTKRKKREAELQHQSLINENELRIEAAEARQQALNARMSDHFISNSIDSINKFVEENDSSNASKYLLTFHRLIRRVLEHSAEKEISLNDDLEILSDYIELEKLRFLPGKIKFETLIDPEIDPQNTLVPPMIFQVLVENSLKHGLTRESGGKIIIEVKKIDNHVVCTVEDNGKGRVASFETMKDVTMGRISLGSNLAERLIKIFSGVNDEKSTLRFFDLKDSNKKPLGTRVEFRIPFIPLV